MQMKYVQASVRYSVVMKPVDNTHYPAGYFVVLISHLMFDIFTGVNVIGYYDCLRSDIV
jgi:hypothetical protein